MNAQLIHQDYMPESLAQHSSYGLNADEHLLKNPEAELREKAWDDHRLAEWENKVLRGERWEWRDGELGKKLVEGIKMQGS
jgi:putative ATPase